MALWNHGFNSRQLHQIDNNKVNDDIIITNMKKTLLLILLALSLATIAFADEAPIIDVLTIDNQIISPVSANYILDGIDSAQKNNRQCIIIRLDTPGGLLESTRDIVKKIMNADIPIVVYITPSGSRAGSAGVFITLASHIAAMAPSTNIGAAHPVQMQKEEGQATWPEAVKEYIRYMREKASGRPIQEKEKGGEDAMKDKILNDTLAWVSTIAKTRARNVEWARATVSESISATEEEALAKGAVDLIAKDLDDLIKQLDGRTIQLQTRTVTLNTEEARLNFIELSLAQQILGAIINPNIAYILLILGFYGLLYEITHPGFGFPGIAGIICLILAFYSFQMLPTNYAGIALIILAFILFLAEIKVPGFGLLAFGGIVSLLLGSLILMDSPSSVMWISMGIIGPVVLSSVAIVAFLAAIVAKVHRKKSYSGKEGMVGEIGVAHTQIAPKGKVFIHGELWDATSGETINKGENVVVVRVNGMKLVVKKQ